MAQGRWVSRLRSTRTGRWIRLNARLESALLTNCLGPCAKLIRRGAKRARSPRHMEAGDGPDSDGGTDAGRSHAGFRRTCLCRLAVAASAPRHGGARSLFRGARRSEEHTSELQSLMRVPYAVFCLK